MVICLLLGVPYEDHEFFERQSNAGLDLKSSEEERMQAHLAMFRLHDRTRGAQGTRTR